MLRYLQSKKKKKRKIKSAWRNYELQLLYYGSKGENKAIQKAVNGIQGYELYLHSYLQEANKNNFHLKAKECPMFVAQISCVTLAPPFAP